MSKAGWYLIKILSTTVGVKSTRNVPNFMHKLGVKF